MDLFSHFASEGNDIMNFEALAHEGEVQPPTALKISNSWPSRIQLLSRVSSGSVREMTRPSREILLGKMTAPNSFMYPPHSWSGVLNQMCRPAGQAGIDQKLHITAVVLLTANFRD